MTDITPALNWGALGLLLVVLAGIGVGLREWYRLADQRENRRMELNDQQERDRAAARAQDTAWLRELVGQVQRTQQANVEAYQQLISKADESQRQVADALQKLCAQYEQHEARAQERHEVQMQFVAGVREHRSG